MSQLMHEDPDGVNAQDTCHLIDEDKREPIAVVGYAYRFPNEAINDDKFWQLMMEKRCAMTEFPADRMNVSGWYHPDKRRRGQFQARGGCFLKEDVSLFDAPFFSLSGNEAAALDPQQRHLLEVTYAALENAGIPIEKMSGSQTSVHVGCFGSDYRLMCLKDIEMTADYDTVGINMCMNANRISWFFDWHGTSMNIDTACSSSLVAMDLACQGLLNRDAEMGIVSGTNLILSPDIMQIESNVNMLSPDSRSYSFDHRANGFCRGEGTATLVLKRLKDALRDGDTIRAVVRATGSNQDGLTPSGIMQPSGVAQTQLIRQTYEKAGLSLKPTRFFEAHGTGTPVGDPIECDAVGKAFRSVRGPTDPLIVGAVKANIGHLEGASGIAAVIKTIMVLEKGIIPPNTNFEKANPRIDLQLLNIRLPLEPTPWPVMGLRRASVNSFGLGGSNAHVVLDDAFNFLRDHGIKGNHHTVEYPTVAIAKQSFTLGDSCQLPLVPRLLFISATSKEGVRDVAETYKTYFDNLSVPDRDWPKFLDNLAHTLNLRRSVMSHKSFWIASSQNELCNVDRMRSKAFTAQEQPVLGFAFTGQGAQWAEMGRELLQYPAYCNSIERCQEALATFGCSWSLYTELARPISTSRIDEPEIAQPANTAMQIALIDLLDGLGVQPAAVVGHSSGEIAAAYAVRAISLSDAMLIAYFRGICAGELANTSRWSGTMLAVGLSAEQTQVYIKRITETSTSYNIGIACVNSPKNVTVSGEAELVDQLRALLEADGIFVRKLRVPVAYHSAQMNQISESYREHLAGLRPRTGIDTRSRIIMVSSVTGVAVQAAELGTPEYWVANLVSPVEFTKAIFGICTESGQKVRKKLDCSHRFLPGVNIVVEIGPHSALQGPIRDTLDTLPWGPDIHYSPVIRRQEHAIHTFLGVVGRLYCLGFPVNLERVNRLPNPTETNQHLLVDLPSYPFNHSTSHWRESRLSKRIRLGNGRVDLLGKQTADWNRLEARWRHHIRLSEMPWVEDHIVNGTLIYPAAGMLVMAIEAAQQMADLTRNVSGYELQGVQFERALTIPRTAEGIETSLLLRTMTEGGQPLPWMQFRLCSYEDGDWHENCHGRIKIDYEASTDLIVDNWLETHNQINSACTTELAPGSLYSTLNRCGFEFGPTFRTIVRGMCNGHQAIASVQVFQWPSSQHPQPHVVHPTTLDGILHLSAAALTGSGQSKIATAVPTRIRRLWISREGLSSPLSKMVRASTSLKTMHSRGHEFDMLATDEQETRLLVRVLGLQSTNVADPSRSGPRGTESGLPIYHIYHVPDVEMMSPEQVALYCAPVLPQDPEPLEFFRDLNFLAYKFLDNAVTAISIAPPTKQVLPHLQRYTDWARLQQSKYQSGQLPLSRPEWRDLLDNAPYFKAVCDRVAGANDLGSIYVNTGRMLPSILRGEQNPLQFLFTGTQMSNWYTELNNRPGCFAPWGRYLQSLSRKNPTMRILEIGAGTGGTTFQVLRAISADLGLAESDALYSAYDYTDISPVFFEQAAQRFAQFTRMNFEVLDISQDPESQGFQVGSYDLIVAANSVHATPSLRRTMQHVQQLLKPRGKVMLYEITRPEIIRSGFIAGLMEGWWSGVDEGRCWSPTLTVSEWDAILQQSGFRGIDVAFPEFIDPECQEANIIVATAATVAPPVPSFCFVIDVASATQQDILTQASKALRLRYPKSRIKSQSLQDSALVTSLTEETMIFLVETERPLLSDMSRETFLQVQKLVCERKSILWVTAGGGESSQCPEFGLVDGWARSLRNEKASRRICTLAFDMTDGIQSHHTQHILSVLEFALLDRSHAQYEREFVEIQGLLHVLRLESAPKLAMELHRASQPYQSAPRPLKDLGSVQLSVSSPGLISSLHWTDDDDGDASPLLPDEVLLENKTVGISFHDVLTALGKVSRTTLGLESAGVVIQAGKSSGFCPGDRALVFGAGKLRTRVRVKSNKVCRIPDNLSFAHATSIPVAFGTMWHALVVVGRLCRGQSVLIHASAGATGQAAIQIAACLGAEIYATVSTTEKRELLVHRYGIAADRIFYSRDNHFAPGIMKATKGRGVDLVISFIGGEVQQASWECVGLYGHLIHLGCGGPATPTALPDLAKQASFTYLDIVSWMDERPKMVQHAVHSVLPLVMASRLSPGTLCLLRDATSIEQGFRSMQEGTTMGRLVVDLTVEAIVPTILATRIPFTLRSDATYVLAGGVGGLGRATAQWMADQGARNLVLLGRSGAKSKEALELIQNLKTQGVYVYAPPCDLMNAFSVQSVMKEVSRTMPPVRGCVQASMVLRDRLFEGMDYEDWRVAVECKALGSKHLIEHLPSALDFLILLSSLSAVHGLQGQSNYAAGNSYLDSLARHLVSHGRKAVSIDLGAMADDGLLSEKAGLLDQIIGFGSTIPLTRTHFLALLATYCNSNQVFPAPESAQLAVGLSSSAEGSYGASPMIEQPLFARLKLERTTLGTVCQDRGNLNSRALFLRATSLQEGRDIIGRALINKMVHSYRLIPEDSDIDEDAPLHTYRVDSLLAVELCNWIAKEFMADLAVLEVMGGATFAMVNLLVASRSQLAHPQWI